MTFSFNNFHSITFYVTKYKETNIQNSPATICSSGIVTWYRGMLIGNALMELSNETPDGLHHILCTKTAIHSTGFPVHLISRYFQVLPPKKKIYKIHSRFHFILVSIHSQNPLVPLVDFVVSSKLESYPRCVPTQYAKGVQQNESVDAPVIVS